LYDTILEQADLTGQQQERAESILNAVLPKSVAKRLIGQDPVIFDVADVTVVIMDIASFTEVLLCEFAVFALSLAKLAVFFLC
jgi:hypothetical protein